MKYVPVAFAVLFALAVFMYGQDHTLVTVGSIINNNCTTDDGSCDTGANYVSYVIATDGRLFSVGGATSIYNFVVGQTYFCTTTELEYPMDVDRTYVELGPCKRLL